ncbi:response regulator transcription factor [Sphingobium sp. HWE2-09]|uniref:response regulator transcription factor n=1 Tax=Sphingobium sp. HWE2-09 TaxID=3108390 RepID=UPI002DCAE324|nr:response regulator [Sphingobium sp. HWE2-09]
MTISHNRLLIVDTDTTQLAQLADNFVRYGLNVEGAASPLLMRERLAAADYALVVLDTAIAPGEGATLLHELAIERRLPVIVHSAALDDAQRIAALEMGAEDCLSKPANPRELLARIRAALRGRADPVERADAPAVHGFAAFEGWRVDMTTGQLFNPGGRPSPYRTASSSC